MAIDLDVYGNLEQGAETDITYRVRDDGKFVAIYDADGEEFLVGARIEDLEKMLDTAENMPKRE